MKRFGKEKENSGEIKKRKKNNNNKRRKE